MALRLSVQLHQLSVLLLKAIMIELLLNETVSREQRPRHCFPSKVCVYRRESLQDGPCDTSLLNLTLLGCLPSHVKQALLQTDWLRV